MYKPVAREQLAETLVHLRSLFQESRPRTAEEQIAHDAREIFTRNLLGNLPRLGEHPMPKTVAEAAQSFHLTMEGAHHLFGYDLSKIREYDLLLNASRTRIIESYPFRQDLTIELPLRLGADEAFERNAFLRDIIAGWQSDLPIRGVAGSEWQRPGTFYVQVGTGDSLGSSLPPGTIAAVEPIEKEEQWHPDARHVYLLQFGNGYLCSGCLVTGNKLSLTIADGRYDGPYEFPYPSAVHIMGRVRNFALSLPVLEPRGLKCLPFARVGAPLRLPWGYTSLPELLAAKSLRFRRSAQEIGRVKSTIEKELHRIVSWRTQRRYRSDTASMPHVNTLIELSLLHMTRYSDVLRTLELFPSDANRYSLETLLDIEHLSELPGVLRTVRTPIPEHRWRAALNQWGEWSTILSMKFPRLQPLEDQVIRLHQSGVFNGLDPLLPSGAILLLDKSKEVHDTHNDHRKKDWARPIYALRKGGEIFCGYLEADRRHYILVPHSRGKSQSLTFAREEVSEVRRAIGAAVPL